MYSMFGPQVMRPGRRKQRHRPGDRDLSPIAEKLDDAGARQPPGAKQDETLVLSPPPAEIQDDTLVHSPPPTPRNPLPPISAYCLPFTDEGGTGCLLKVAEAARGASVLFRLTSTAAEHARVVVKLNSTDTYASQRYYLPDSKERQAYLSGTVEYEGRPKQMWHVTAQDPLTRVAYWVREPVRRGGKFWFKVVTQTHLRDQGVITLYYYKVDIDRARWPSPPPSPPRPPPPSPPPPPPCPTPITAYCLPFVDDSGTGCLLKVARACPGSEVLFHLKSAAGERARAFVQLDSGATSGSRLFYLAGSNEVQAMFTGTVAYADGALGSWPCGQHDPDAKYTFLGFFRESWSAPAFPKTSIKVPVGNGKVLTLYGIYRPWDV